MTKAAVKPATTYRAIVGQILSSLRSERGMTQTDVADRMGLTQSAWSRLERGGNALSIDQMRDVASVFRVPTSAILDHAEQVEKRLRRRGIRVETSQPESALGRGLAIIGIAALATVVAAVLLKNR